MVLNSRNVVGVLDGNVLRYCWAGNPSNSYTLHLTNSEAFRIRQLNSMGRDQRKRLHEDGQKSSTITDYVLELQNKYKPR